MNDAVSYIQIIFLFMSVSYAYNFLSGILRAVGDSKNPVIAMVIACIINVVLDVVLVMYVHMVLLGQHMQQSLHRHFLHCIVYGVI